MVRQERSVKPSAQPTLVRTQHLPPCDVSSHRGHREPTSGVRCFLWPARWSAGGLVVLVRVEGEFAEELAGGGTDDADVQVLDQEQDAGSGVSPAGADVVQPAVVAEGDDPGPVDAVGADPVVGVGSAVAGAGFGPGGAGGGGGRAAGERSVRALGVVDAGEGVDERLRSLMAGGWPGWARSQFFIVCWKRSTLPWVWGWFGLPFFCLTPRRRSSCSRALRPPLPPDRRW
jgi:hypothetical protein